MSAESSTATDGDHGRPLAVYLRDHFAGSSAGLALIRRIRREHAGTALDETLGGVEAEIEEDRRALEAMMSRLGVSPSAVKSALGSLAETIARLKSNGRVVRPSPSSVVVELEGLAAGILTKRNLWRAMLAAAQTHPVLSPAELDELITRATSQLDRVLQAHESASREAFVAPASAATNL